MSVTDKLATTVGSAYKFLSKAVEARDTFYRGMDEAVARALVEKHPNFGPEDAKVRFGESLVAKQLIADNKWHMAQSRTFALASIASGVLQMVYEQQQTNKLLKENNTLLRNMDNNLDAIHSTMKEMQVY